MDPFSAYTTPSNPQQFWSELDDILDTPFHPSSPLLDSKRLYVSSILTKFLHLCAASFNDNLTSEYNQEYCINRLFSSTAFRDDADSGAEGEEGVAMHQLAAEDAIKTMQTSTSIPVLLMTYEIVLQYGEAFPATYKSIVASASTVSFVGVRAFLHRLVHQIWAGSYAAQAEAKLGVSNQEVGWNGAHWDEPLPQPTPSTSAQGSTYLGRGGASKEITIQISLRQKAVRMLYEVCRVQKLEPSHLKAFDERFIHHLFDLVEETRHHHDEDFNYRLIKLLVAMNEQYMVSTSSSAKSTNLVLGVLQQRLNASKTFGENLIFMLNRASSSDAEDVCMQLLVLKLLYLLFTTKETACYFYTNDLRVLVDIFIRELQDLPDESESLRHTYLRVLHPLLTNTQLCSYPYKRPQIRRLLNGLLAHGHLRDISATTRRLVERCLRAEWCVELDRLDGTERVVVVQSVGGGEKHDKLMQPGVTTEGLPMIATEIKGGSKSVQATADSLAATTQEEVESPLSIDSPALSLSVPGLRTRDKRVASLSSPRSPRGEEERPATASSLGKATGREARRTVSAQSAPTTPPRVGSPALQPPRQNTRLSELSSPNTDDDALSASSSWHEHMADPTDPRGAGREAVAPLIHSLAPDASSPRIGSPLSTEISSLQHQLEGHSCGNGETPKARRKPPQPPSIAARRAMQLSSSDPTFPSPTSSAMGSRSNSPATEDPAGVGKSASGGRRRPPPPPPTAGATPTSENGREEDEMEQAQSWYIAERLRRGLRIR